MNREQLMQLIDQASAEDPGFRARLIADPRAVIGGLLDTELPDSVNFTVHEESLTDIHLVLENDASTLSESDLELVSGGWQGQGCYSCI